MAKVSRLTLAFFLLLAGVSQAQAPSNWADSSEALFLTGDERREWAALESNDEREAFKARYWLRRDPTPREAGNEFRDAVLGRIRRADERFPLRRTPGSQTARGLAFVLLGTPARVQDTAAGRLAAPPPPGTPPSGAVGLLEGIETQVVWIYDRERTPALLEALGRPSLELQFIIEPQRGTDRLQQPGLFHELREILAARSIVTAVTPAAPPAAAAPPAGLDEGAREKLAAVPEHDAGVVTGHTVIWSDSAGPELHAWVFLPAAHPARSQEIRFHTVVRDSAGKDVAAWSEAAAMVPALFSTSAEGSVFTIHRPLPPGRHEIQLGFSSASGWHALTSAEVDVPNLDGDAFAVSPLVVSAGPSSEPARLSLSSLPARADATFSISESLWTVVELANVPAPADVTIDLTLARDGQVIGGTGEQPANPVKTDEDRYLAAFELPLATLSPGDYVLSVTVRKRAGSDEGRAVRQVPIRLVAG